MEFITIKVSCPPDIIEILIAQLFEINFDSFQEFDDGFEGSCEQSLFDKKKVDELFEQNPNVEFVVKEQEKINWNEEWEKNYDPIIVSDQCLVRASFHDSQPQFEYEIIVTPKMSFGTGHHATTQQMLAHQLTLDHDAKKVLDVGTGTGILTIMAHKRGATSIVATDIDEWSIENSKDNFMLNNVNDVNLIQGQISEVNIFDFDIIIANINKNVLLAQIEEYARRLAKEGKLILSGFYEDDIEDLEIETKKFGLKKSKITTKDNWAILVLDKHAI